MYRRCEQGHPGEAQGHGWVGGAEHLLPDRQGASVERLRLDRQAVIAIELAQAMQAQGHGRVGGAEHLLLDRQGAPVERLRLGVPPLLRIESGEIGEEHGHLRVHGSLEHFAHAHLVLSTGMPPGSGRTGTARARVRLTAALARRRRGVGEIGVRRCRPAG